MADFFFFFASGKKSVFFCTCTDLFRHYLPRPPPRFLPWVWFDAGGNPFLLSASRQEVAAVAAVGVTGVDLGVVEIETVVVEEEDQEAEVTATRQERRDEEKDEGRTTASRIHIVLVFVTIVAVLITTVAHMPDLDVEAVLRACLSLTGRFVFLCLPC